jgi:hypothetical protein
MSDDLRKRSPQDRSRISLVEPWEVRYWTHKFGVTRDQLEAAIRKVGHSVWEVAAELDKPVPADDELQQEPPMPSPS